MKNSFLIIALLGMLVGCGTDDLTSNTMSIQGTFEKAWQDTLAEAKRANSNFNDEKSRANDSLVDFNKDFNREATNAGEWVGDRTANSDTNVSGAFQKAVDDFNRETTNAGEWVGDRTANSDTNVSDALQKANEDFNDEKSRLKDQLVGSDERTLNEYSDRLNDLERRMTLVEQLIKIQGSLISLHDQRLNDLDSDADGLSDDLLDLSNLVSKLTYRMISAESKINVLETLTNSISTATLIGLIEDLDGRVEALENAVVAPCTLSVDLSTVNDFKVCIKTSPIGGGPNGERCSESDKKTLWKADVKLICGSETPTVLKDVLFEKNPT